MSQQGPKPSPDRSADALAAMAGGESPATAAPAPTAASFQPSASGAPASGGAPRSAKANAVRLAATAKRQKAHQMKQFLMPVMFAMAGVLIITGILGWSAIPNDDGNGADLSDTVAARSWFPAMVAASFVLAVLLAVGGVVFLLDVRRQQSTDALPGGPPQGLRQ